MVCGRFVAWVLLGSLAWSGSASAAERGAEGSAEPVALATWSAAEVQQGLADCQRRLAPLAADYDVLPPLRDGECGTPAPVRLRRLGPAPGVELSPPVVINCAIADRLADWLATKVQPLAKQSYGAPVARLVTLASYDCRGRIGTSNTKLSEHGKANAIDVGAVVLADGRSIDVLGQWGSSKRDRVIVAAAPAAAPATGGKIEARPNPDAVVPPVKRQPPPAVVVVPAKPDPQSAANAAFLHAIHDGACGIFGTVLGPDANEAHRNHLHLDLAVRRHSAFCE